jgi:hypothetical protein
MRTAVCFVLMVLVAGCTADERRPVAAPEPATEPTPTVVVQKLPADLASLPRLRTALPRRVPADASSLPALMSDPPGRATMVYHPAEMWPEPGEGWVSETLLFHGVDGRWLRLRMDELGLSDASWPGPDTYGAGSLSPDGRRWAGQSRDGVILLDLGTGRVETIDLGTRWTASVEWRDDSRSLVVGHGGHGQRAEVVELPSRRRTVLPYEYWQADFAPDGTAYSLKAADRGRAEVISWRGDRPVSLGDVPLPGLRSWQDGMIGPDVIDGHLLAFVQRAPYRIIDLVVIGTADLQVEARLHLSSSQMLTYRAAEWLDPETVVLETGRGLIAWRPADGRFFRVTRTVAPRNGYVSLDVAADLAR